MLKVFRDNLKYFSWVLWIVIAAFILFYIPDFMTPRGNVNAAAAVWGEEITYQELRETLRNVEAQLRQIYGEELPPDFAKRSAFDQLVNSKILLREARRLGLEVGNEELSREIMSFPSLQGADGKFVGQQEIFVVCEATASIQPSSKKVCEWSCCSASSRKSSATIS